MEGAVQGVLFDSPLTGKTKSDKSIMDYPFFALDRCGRRKRPIEYNDGNVTVQIKANNGSIATVYDKDLILYVAGLMREQMNQGIEPGRTFTFSAYDFMRVTKRPKNDDSYERILKMLERLQGTQICTNIEHGGAGVDGFFSWLDSASASYGSQAGHKKTKYIRVTICEWLYLAIYQGNVLTYDPRYFQLRPLARRLYDIARSHCGRQKYWAVKLPKLREKIGFEGELRRLRYEMDQMLQQSEPIPEYRFRLINDRNDNFARHLERDGFRIRPSGRASNQDIVVLFEFIGGRNRDFSEIRKQLSEL